MGSSPTSSSPVVHAVQRLILRTARTRSADFRRWRTGPRSRRYGIRHLGRPERRRLRPRWGGDRRLPARGIGCRYHRRLRPGRGGRAATRARRRWRRLFRMVPVMELLVETPMVFEGVALDELAGTSALTFGFDGPGEPVPVRAGYFGAHASFDWLRTLERPGLYGLGADWRLLAGPERRPQLPVPIPRRGASRLGSSCSIGGAGLSRPA